MKKIFLVLLVLALAVGAYAGGNKAATTGAQEIRLLYGLSMTESPPIPSDWIGFQLIKDRLGIDLKVGNLPSDPEAQNVTVMGLVSANNLPDIVQINRTPWTNAVRMGMLGAVDDLYPLMPLRTQRMYDAQSIAYTTVNGKSYGLANTSSMPRNEGLVIRKDWLDKLGLAIPVTTEDLMNVMRAFTNNDPDGNGRADTYGYGAFIEIETYEEGLGRRFEPIMGAFGVAGTWDLSTANAGLNVRKPAMFDALTYVKRMVDERVIDPNWVSLGKDDFRAAWKQGRFGIMREQFAALVAQANYAPFDQNFPNGQWIVIDPPKGPTGLSSVGVFPNAYRTYALSARTVQEGKGPEIAKLLEWMISDDGYYLLGWGQRDVNYVLDANGVPTSAGIPDASKWDNPSVVSITQLRNIVFWNSPQELLARYPTYRAATSGKTINILDVYYDMEKRAWTPNDGSNALELPSADVKRFYEQGVMEFVLGQNGRTLTQANWTAWVQQFDSMGGKAWEDAGVAKARADGWIK